MISSPMVPAKVYEYKQENKTYKIELAKNINNVILTIKNISKVESYYKSEISLENIQMKNQVFRMFKTIDEFINSFEGFIINKNASIKESNNSLTLDVLIFNFINGNKEKVSFEFNKIENTNKDEIIKSLIMKVNDLEEKYNKLKENYEKIMAFVGPMMEKKEEKFKFQWENNENCELSKNNTKLRKIKNQGWNTNVKGNKILKKNAINVFKIKVNNINSDKSGLSFGIVKKSSVSSSNLYENDWNINCTGVATINSKFESFKNEAINKDDIVTFIVDLKNGNLEVKKNDISLGKLDGIPLDEDLVPCVCNYYVDNEIEIVE